MACCGKGRQQLGAIVGSPAPAPVVRPARRLTIAFEYVGQTAMTVVGPTSRRRYRFDAPGAQVVIDPRDRPALARVPHLREVG